MGARLLTRRELVAGLAVLPVLARGRAAAALAAGNSGFSFDIAGRKLDLFFYRPPGYVDGPILLVMHGSDRNAWGYRDHARPLADKHGMLVVAPEFEEKRFPTRLYQHGGIVRHLAEKPGSEPSGQRPARDWTVSLIPAIATAARGQAGISSSPYYVIGHSAGGQFVQKVAAFAPAAARRIVAANPGVHLFPTLDAPYPFGFGGLKPPVGGEAGLKRYLAAPLTFYQGTGDTTQDRHFPRGFYPDQQGRSRNERGHNCFAAGEKLAKETGWPFNWRLVEARGVTHESTDMFLHPNATVALGLDS